LRDTNGLSSTHLQNLDRLIDAVKEDPQFLQTSLAGKTDLKDTPFLTADAVTCCALLVAHVDLTSAVTGGQPAADAEMKRRLDFARNATLAQLLEIRQQAAQILGS
jgi:hypothetical protein